MYVAPRPRLEDDPLFAPRIALTCVLAFVAVQWIQPAVPALVVSLPLALLAGQRKRFDPVLGIAAPIAFVGMVWTMALAVEVTRPMPALMLAITFLVVTGGFYTVRRTGSPIGMLLIMAASLMSVMGLKGPGVLDAFKDGFTQGALLGAALEPALYLLLPPSSDQPHERQVALPEGHHGAGSVIRGVVLMLLCFWLYAVMPASDMVLAIAAIFVLVFPTRREAFSEVAQRTLATVYGTLAALAILWLLTWNAHFAILLGSVALAGLFFASRMMSGPRPSMVYQYALSVCIVLVATALASQSPAYASIMRVLLTAAGAIAAAVMVAALDGVFLRRTAKA